MNFVTLFDVGEQFDKPTGSAHSLPVLIKNAEVEGQRMDVRLAASIVALHPALQPGPGEQVLDARGGLLLPGLHDHHIHLRALQAVRESVDCAPAAVPDRDALREVLSAQPGTGWLRGVGYHESSLGELDRGVLDVIAAHRPVRIQHRSGKLWVLNSAALALLDLSEAPEGLERTARGEPTGRLFRLDGWLGSQLPQGTPDLEAVAGDLVRLGITGITEASFTNDLETLGWFAEAAKRGAWPLRWRLMGDETLPGGPLKIMLDEDALPDIDRLGARVAAAHRRGRPVAFHCVSEVESVLAMAVLEAQGAAQGDRIEHGGILRADALGRLRELGVTVVTQPGFIAHRGERFRLDNPPDVLRDLYRYQSLLESGVPVAASSDAPYGPLNPWLIMHAAVERRTETGVEFNPAERVTPEEALRGYLSEPDDPGGTGRRVCTGAPSDLCLIDRPWSRARQALDQVRVQATWVGGELVYTALDRAAAT